MGVAIGVDHCRARREGGRDGGEEDLAGDHPEGFNQVRINGRQFGGGGLLV
jgi:hypothetical protein